MTRGQSSPVASKTKKKKKKKEREREREKLNKKHLKLNGFEEQPFQTALGAQWKKKKEREPECNLFPYSNSANVLLLVLRNRELLVTLSSLQNSLETID